MDEKENGIEYISSCGKVVDFLTSRYLCSRRRTRVFLELYVLLEDDFFTFMSIFAGKSIKFPKLSVIKKMQRDLCVYNDFGKMSLDDMTKKHGLRKTSILNIKKKIDSHLEEYDILKEEIDDERFKKSYRAYKRVVR